MNTLFIILSVFLIIKASKASNGIDMSSGICSSMNQTNWNCLRNQANNFAIIQTFSGGYGFNTKISTCVSEARTAGFLYVDVYAYICPNCVGNNPIATTMTTMINNLKTVNYGMLWIDIEECGAPGTCWSATNFTANADFIQTAVQTAINANVSVGIYSSEGEWSTVLGTTSRVVFPSVPLWYAHYDNVAAFSDTTYYQFGGWTKPNIKQYSGSATQCSISVDLNWYPNSIAHSSSVHHSSFHHSSTHNMTGNSSTHSGSIKIGISFAKLCLVFLSFSALIIFQTIL